ncbi:MAG: translation initiation factor Sui1 [Steroidobacteraceae bacterium]
MHKAKYKSSNTLNHTTQAYSTTVYSTDGGRLCPGCSKPLAACNCKQQHSSTVGDGVVRISRETKGRGGKSVNVISGLRLMPTELEALCTKLKKRCGTGGTCKDGNIEIQGEHRDTLVAELTKLGHNVKKAGG